MRLRDLLRSGSARWHSTDWLLVEAGFDEDLDLGQAIDATSRTGLIGDLPVNFFRDRGKSARKYILGALKALYWLECVGWRNYTSQAVEWRWIQPVRERVAPPPLGRPSAFVDAYLTDDSLSSRRERIDARAAELTVEFAGEAQQWIRENHPTQLSSGRKRNLGECVSCRGAGRRSCARQRRGDGWSEIHKGHQLYV
jgi:hypothetical protein